MHAAPAMQRLAGSALLLAFVVGCGGPSAPPKPSYAEVLAVYTSERQELDRLESELAKLTEKQREAIDALSKGLRARIALEQMRASIDKTGRATTTPLSDDEMREAVKKEMDNSALGQVIKQRAVEIGQLSEKVRTQTEIVRKAEAAKNSAAPK